MAPATFNPKCKCGHYLMEHGQDSHCRFILCRCESFRSAGAGNAEPNAAPDPRILEVNPEPGTRLAQLRDAAMLGAIEMATEMVTVRSAGLPPGARCFQCGSAAYGDRKLIHQSTCPAGKILAYVDAVNAERMDAEAQSL